MKAMVACPWCGTQQEVGAPKCQQCGAEFRPSGPIGFYGSGGELSGIHFVNLLLTAVTLGIYYFWGRARVRRYLVGQTQFQGEPFAYHGAGGEQLIGFLRAVLVLGVFFGGLVLVSKALPALGLEAAGTAAMVLAVAIWAVLVLVLGLALGVILTFVLSIVVALSGNSGLVALAAVIGLLGLVPIAIVGTRRYQLSRTSWRGIRFSFRGRAPDFAKVMVPGALLTLVTLGLYYPIFDTARHGFLVSHSYFGNRKFEFDGRGRDLMWPFLAAILLTIPTLGLCWFWFTGRRQRYFWDHTVFATARFHSTVSGGGLLSLSWVNGWIDSLTFGLCHPWITIRNINYTVENLTLEGELDVAAIHQEAQAASAMGDELQEMLGDDVGFAGF